VVLCNPTFWHKLIKYRLRIDLMFIVPYLILFSPSPCNFRKTKHSKTAKTHLDQVAGWLSEKDDSLAQAARDHTPEEEKASKKRKQEENGHERSKKTAPAKTKAGAVADDITLGEREERAMENLCTYIEEQSGDRRAVENFRCRVTRKPSDGRYDTNYYNEEGRRFRSMVEVGKFFNLVAAPARSAGGKKAAGMKKRKATSRDIENEKKKFRKELDKLRRQHTKSRKQLDDFLTDEKDSRYPVDDMLLQKDDGGQSLSRNVLPTNCPAARVPDIDTFHGLPQHCMPEVLAVWDFMCAFTRNLNVNPISLDDFIQCLIYKPPPNMSESDAFGAPPVFLGEAHLGLLKLILADRSSDAWWWSILETDITENAVADVADAASNIESDLPLIKVDFAALLLVTEDPLITQSWLQNLEKVRSFSHSDMNSIRDAIRGAMSLVANKWVLAYLRKALKLGKTSGSTFMKRSIIWLVDKFREARPDLNNRSVNTQAVLQKRAKVVEDVTQQMDKLSSAALAVNDEDLVSDIEESDDESDESDDEDENENKPEEPLAGREDPDERPASYIPKKPPPSLVDLLLPPGKPAPPTDLLNPSSWPEIAGATAARIIHRFKRLRNELDDSLRLIRELPRLTVKQRRERESVASKRVFSEFAESNGGENPPQQAVDHLCAGGNYLDLSPLQRLCILRVLIDAAYDTGRVYEIVDSNHKQRTNAIKALDTEQRRAKKEAKENAAAAEAAAREDLALEARRKFLEEKREEIRSINKANQELTQEEIDELTEEDILDFDDDIRADFEALPTAESFKKAEVVARVEQIKEAAAFETEILTVLTMPELLEREEAELKSMEESLQELGGEEALLDPQLERHIVRRIEKARRDIEKAKVSTESLPIQREAAMETLQEAIADGTIKSLRAAIRIAKGARLFGLDEYSNGVWTLDLVRDAHMELEEAKQLKRVADAQKDLITKLTRCFIRTQPLGMDRFRNRLWRFENTEQGHVWAEVNPVLQEANSQLSNQDGFLKIVSNVPQVSVGAADIEEDFLPREAAAAESFARFSRQEYHASGISLSLTKRHWGCHTTETSVRALMKGLDGRGIRENELKTNLKEALEKATAAENSTEELKATTVEAEESKSGDAEEDEKEKSEKAFQTSGDENLLDAAKQSMQNSEEEASQYDLISSLCTGIGQRARVRIVVETTRDSEIARYEDALVTGWKIRKDEVQVEMDGDEFDPQIKIVDTPIWHTMTGNGQELWLTGAELLQGICRFIKRTRNDVTYFESDAAFLAYRNSLGRYCGKAAEAAHAMTPIRFCQFMVRREAELYQRLKHIVYDNAWGGKSGNRNAWVASMKDFAFDLQTAKEGLMTLESALVEMTGGRPESAGEEEPSGRALLDNPSTREDIELESIDKALKTLWNSRASRAVFLEIMKTCQTVGFLALGFELLTRNTVAYIDANTVKGSAAAAEVRPYEAAVSSRGARRGATFWQDEDSAFFDDMPARSSRRATRVNYMGLD
jgi:hypothetical protein